MQAVSGRPEGDEVAYVLPRHPAEVDRLDVQHYAIRQALSTNHLAPVRWPALVVDVGAGTGQWAYELCDEFRDARVIGMDLVRGKPGAPGNYHHIRGNVLRGLPFGTAEIDYVHQGFMYSAVPVRCWPGVVRELLRVVRPGGWGRAGGGGYRAGACGSGD